MPTFRAYAANTASGPLQPFEFDPGEIGDEEVEIKVSHCGICHSMFPMSQVNDAFEHLRSGKARYRIVLVNEQA